MTDSPLPRPSLPDFGAKYNSLLLFMREERGQNYEYLPLSTGKNLAIRDNRFNIL
jgi:hypothetical protein